MNEVLKKIRVLSIAPHDPETVNRWLEQEDALLLLEKNASEDKIVVYAGLPHGRCVCVIALDFLFFGEGYEGFLRQLQQE